MQPEGSREVQLGLPIGETLTRTSWRELSQWLRDRAERYGLDTPGMEARMQSAFTVMENHTPTTYGLTKTLNSIYGSSQQPGNDHQVKRLLEDMAQAFPQLQVHVELETGTARARRVHMGIPGRS